MGFLICYQKKMLKILSNDDCAKVVQYLINVDNDFEIPISSKVSIKEYAEKLLTSGYILAIENNGVICGILGMYANDIVNRIGYISILSVSVNQRGNGYAKLLVEGAIKLGLEKNLNSIKVDSVNPIAVSLYCREGFVPYKKESNQFNEKVYLIKLL